MARVAKDLPQFRDLGRDDETCIFPVKTEASRCLRCRDRYTRKSAATLHQTILSSSLTDPCLDESLARFLDLSFCWQHQKICRELELGRPICEKWRTELSAKECKVAAGKQKLDERPSSGSSTPFQTPPSGRVIRSQSNVKQVVGKPPPETLTLGEAAGKMTLFDNVKYIPYGSNRTRTFFDLLHSNLAKRARDPGIVYVERRGVMVKIGFTARSVQKRQDDARRTCGRITEHHYSTDWIPHAFRVEQLVHLELRDSRFKEVSCKCGVGHEEWFHEDVGSAIRVVRSWATWMNLARPYNEAGDLLPEWAAKLKAMRRDNIPVTGQALLDQIHTRMRESPPVVGESIHEASQARRDPSAKKSIADGHREEPGKENPAKTGTTTVEVQPQLHIASLSLAELEVPASGSLKQPTVAVAVHMRSLVSQLDQMMRELRQDMERNLASQLNQTERALRQEMQRSRRLHHPTSSVTLGIHRVELSVA
ncbi:hypothetical protein A1O3_04893 [Capronia epimyces CBS 606.96]|uniref:Bacteriophage T5 Orf172 DNA-binding domain-containing protein n=1 Tax=Capronia epimyces CBS 606.96 TaxID=1182542 RepID=W9Y4S6_9EURO|nr:uncharacterized protein A1O3_04893 [Capronia epimyces CBS 606.96]EXJ84226.1 hypothetical protein A1O3_04893 [Capronia epimyces CBS 606.96]